MVMWVMCGTLESLDGYVGDVWDIRVFGWLCG